MMKKELTKDFYDDCKLKKTFDIHGLTKNSI